jgi:DNA-binding MarR family transcriptional regulator
MLALRLYLHMLALDVKSPRRRKEVGMAKEKTSPNQVGDGQLRRCSCTALRKATRRVSQLYDAALASSGLKTTQRAILAQIDRAKTTTVGNLAEALVMDSGALAHNLKPLERDGLVTIEIDAKDRRNRLVTLTDAGRAKLSETDILWAHAQRGFDAAFGAAETASLREALGFIVSDAFVETFETAANPHRACPA